MQLSRRARDARPQRSGGGSFLPVEVGPGGANVVLARPIILAQQREETKTSRRQKNNLALVWPLAAPDATTLRARIGGGVDGGARGGNRSPHRGDQRRHDKCESLCLHAVWLA